MLRRELDVVSDRTTSGLLRLLEDRAPMSADAAKAELRPLRGTLSDRRAIMSSNHLVLLRELVEAVGEDEATKLGREAMFAVGRELGIETKRRLGVRETTGDMLLAARVLYRVLGIDFEVEEASDSFRLLIHRCALAEHYSESTCRVLSATDEGVVSGLSPGVCMRFERIQGAEQPMCVARIRRMEGGLE
jgi:hypothetical protein